MQRSGGRRKNQLLRKRPTIKELDEELDYMLTRAQQVQQEVMHSVTAMVATLKKNRRHQSLVAGLGILEEYISSIVQCGEDADEAAEESTQEPKRVRAEPNTVKS